MSGGEELQKKINGDQHYDTASNLGEKDKKLLFSPKIAEMHGQGDVEYLEQPHFAYL